MNQERFKQLAEGYANGDFSAADLRELKLYLEHPEYRETLDGMMQELQVETEAGYGTPDAVTVERIERFIAERIGNPSAVSTGNKVLPMKKVWLRYAAAVVLILAGALTWFRYSDKKQTLVSETINAVPAGKQGAILTLADGRQLVLDSMGNGIVAIQNGAQAVLKNGQLTYDPAGNTADETVYNTISVQKGRQFQLTLQDGTQVWLNSASSIRYPTVFSGKERRVEISGEAYFDVTKNKAMPFRVNVDKKAEITVLGTSFNINAYENEGSIKTTLVEGVVRVQNLSKDLTASANKEVVIMPGQQAIVLPTDNRDKSTIDQRFAPISIAQNLNIDKIIAWKKGIFNFEGSTLVEVMRELERWYDIDVVYKGVPPVIRFVGKLQKDLTLNDLLDVLTRSNVKFELDGRKLIVKG